MPAHERGAATRPLSALLLAAAVVALASACGVTTPTAQASGASQPAAHVATRSPAKPGAGRSATAAAAARARIGVMGHFRTGLRQLTFTEPAHNGPTCEQLGPRSLLTYVRYPLAWRPTASRPARPRLPLHAVG